MTFWGKVLLVLAAAPVAAVSHGLAISIMWGWFVVPLGMPSLSIAHAFGLALLLRMVSTRMPKSDDRDWRALIAASIAAPWLVVGVGWIVNAFMEPAP